MCGVSRERIIKLFHTMNEQQQNQQQANPSAAMGGAQDKAKEAMHGLEAYLAPLFQNLPHIPQGGRDFLVSIAPWLALVFGALGVWGGVKMLGFGGGAYGDIMRMAGYSSSSFMVSALFNIASSALLLAGFMGLKAREKKGWNMAFYSMVVSVIGGVVSVVMGMMFGVIGLAIGAFIGFYLLFEIRSSYK
jgi:hypothetical protein